jgi:hypothetical protein
MQGEDRRSAVVLARGFLLTDIFPSDKLVLMKLLAYTMMFVGISILIYAVIGISATLENTDLKQSNYFPVFGVITAIAGMGLKTFADRNVTMNPIYNRILGVIGVIWGSSIILYSLLTLRDFFSGPYSLYYLAGKITGFLFGPLLVVVGTITFIKGEPISNMNPPTVTPPMEPENDND